MLLFHFLLVGVAVAATPTRTTPIVPVRGGKAPADAVRVRTDDSLELAGLYYAPKPSTNRVPAAILVHDAGGNKEQMTLFAERLQGQGLAVLVLDLRGQGESKTSALDWGRLDSFERTRMWAYTTRDIEAGSAWLKSRREVHSASLAVVGLRAGCSLAANHAARDGNVRAVVLIEPSFENLGFDLAGEISSLAGLETKVFSSREHQAEVEEIKRKASAANEGEAFIEIDLLKSRGDELLRDRRVAGDLAKWVQDRVFPKKGSR